MAVIDQLFSKTKPSEFAIPENKWSLSATKNMGEEELLLYRSNLLGSDLTVTNFGGGNTSAKILIKDPLTMTMTEVLWVKGSGGDIGQMKLDGFSTLYLEKLNALKALYRGKQFEDEMVGFLPHCNFNNNSRPASIDTPLHAYLPFKHIDHVHPDAIIALAASSGGKAAAQQIWGDAIGWIEWQRPGFELGLLLSAYAKANPNSRGAILAGHGIICWANSAKDCYDNTISLIADAAKHLNNKLSNSEVFGGSFNTPLPAIERAQIISDLSSNLRGIVSSSGSKISHFCDTKEVLEFVCSNSFIKLAKIGTSCPDHFLRTKIAPLCLAYDKIGDLDYLHNAVSNYRSEYEAYYKRCAGPSDPNIRDSNPIIVLIPRIGMVSFASDKTTARLASEFYQNAINVMRGAQLIGQYIGLSEQEAFNIEYWSLEEAKLQRMPKPKPLAGKIALITGGAGGIGLATARRLLDEGASVVLSDFDKDALEFAHKALVQEYSKDVVRSVICDVTDEAQTNAAFRTLCREFGGLDILVANAGIASSAPISETSVELWNKNYNVLALGYFLASKCAFEIMKSGGGGSIIFIGSKNAVAAAANASAYASAKAASLHLARCLALEGAPFKIRVNVVNPDAVIRGSKIWNGDWRKERADTHGIDAGLPLEEHYRNRSMLKLDVLPEDVANAVYFFASEMSAKSTGNMINVDAGNAQAFSR
ncbi:MAG: short chain dehydrogenase [Hyphomonadaceae bacterium]|nr:MAG: short chain dehydrogenase [Hyphomonadaceae bacterium]